MKLICVLFLGGLAFGQDAVQALQSIKKRADAVRMGKDGLVKLDAIADGVVANLKQADSRCTINYPHAPCAAMTAKSEKITRTFLKCSHQASALASEYLDEIDIRGTFDEVSDEVLHYLKAAADAFQRCTDEMTRQSTKQIELAGK